MKRIIIVLTALCLLISIEALAQKKASKTKTAATPAAAAKKTYETKSGKAVYDVDLIGKQTQTLYWDDYGAKEARVTLVEMEVLGQKSRSESVEINADGYIIKYDIEKKTGTKTKSYSPLGAAKGFPSDVSKMAQKDIEKMNIVDLGTKEILGKKCKGIQMEPMKMKMEAWVWGSLLMESKTWLSKDGAPMTINVSSLELDVPIPPETFKVPDGIQIEEY